MQLQFTDTVITKTVSVAVLLYPGLGLTLSEYNTGGYLCCGQCHSF